MDLTQKQFYLDQAKRLKDTFNSKYPDYVYRRRPNNSRKKRRTDAGTPPDPDELSGGDPSPVEIEDLDADRSPQYPFNNQELSPAADEIYAPAPAHNSSTLPSHGTSYSPYPYPQSNSHRNHMSLHQQHQQHNYANSIPRSQQSLSVNSSPLLHSHSSLRSASAYSPHDNTTLSYPLSNGLQMSNSQSQSHSGYYGYQNERGSGNSPHGASLSNATAIQGSMNSHWLPPPLANTQQQYPQYSGRERAYTTTALPAMKSSFPSPDVSQLSLPPMLSNGATRMRRPASGGQASHGGGGTGVGNYLPSFFSSSSSAAVSPAASSNGGHGYFPSPPSTSSSTSAGTVNGVDRILTPPDLGPFDMSRNGHGQGEISVGYHHGWDRK